MSEKGRAEPSSNIENRLRSLRLARGLSQGTLAGIAGITRQAVYAIEANQYLPTTAVALRLAGALDCRVEDLFSLISSGEVIEGDLVGGAARNVGSLARARAKVTRVGDRVVVRPVADLGETLTYTVPADGLILTPSGPSHRGAKPGLTVRVQLLRDRRMIEQEIAVAGCDPAIFLAGEYLRRRHEKETVVGWNLGSAAAVEALKRGEVHMAGLHMVDAKSGESNLPYLKRHLKSGDFTVITFAKWEAGLMVRHGNPRGIREVADLARKGVTVVNREEGSGARVLLEQRLTGAGIKMAQVKECPRHARSHFEVARVIAEGHADVGVGMRAAAGLLGLDFIPLQEERYDLVTSTAYLSEHPGLEDLLDTLLSRTFRTELEALGGYDTRETGKIREF
jgi:molybdate-binding protein/DNA-binding XRE family transcriptional regulator